MKMIFFKTQLIGVLLVALTTTYTGAHADEHSTDNIVETAKQAGQFNTLLAAASAAGLVPALSDSSPLTVFAPTDEAFDALPAGTIDSLLKAENRHTLIRILSFHVVSGKVGSEALVDNVTLDTLAGPKVSFVAAEKGFTIEGARLIATDMQASNGIVHVIDRVIMPPPEMSRTDVQALIMSTINQGAPMFNHGDHSGTVELYTNTTKTLLSSAQLTSNERQRLKRALKESEQMASPQQSAWALRYALDDVIRSMHGQMI